MSWNGSDNKSDSSVKNKAMACKPSPWRGVLAGIVVVVLALAAVFVFVLRNEEGAGGQQPGKKGGMAPVAPASAKTKPVAAPPAVKKSKPSVAKQGAGGSHAPVMAVDEVDESAATNIVSSSREDRRLFKNPMDQLLSMVLPKKPGATIPPLPNIDSITFTPEEEDQLLERLAASDDDSDERLERKEFVQALRDEYHELKKSHGWRFVDYVKALEAKVNLDAEVLSESIKINETVFNDASISDEEYSKTLAKINEILAARGIEPIGNPGEETPDESDEQQEEN